MVHVNTTSSQLASSLFMSRAMSKYLPWLVAMLCTSLVIKFLTEQWQEQKRFKHLPRLPTSWGLGTLLGTIEIFFCMSFVKDVAKGLLETSSFITQLDQQKRDGVLYFRLGLFRNYVVFFDANGSRELLSHSKNIHKAKEYSFIKAWLGEGLLTS